MDAFEAIADPVRRSLLADLASGGRRVVDLADARPISRPAVSKHLRLLLEAGAVNVTDRGRERYYALEAAGLSPVHDFVVALIASTAHMPLTTQALDALDTEVRRAGRARRNRDTLNTSRSSTSSTSSTEESA